MNPISDHILKITGGASMAEELDPSKRHKITDAEFDIYEAAKRDNQDGTFSLIYKAKFTSALTIDEAGKPIRGIDKSKKSKKLRGALWWLAQEEKASDYDVFYETVMDKIIRNISEVWAYLKNK